MQRRSTDYHQGFSLILALFCVAAAGLLSLGAAYVWRRTHEKHASVQANVPSVQLSPVPPDGKSGYAGWKAAVSPRAGFSIRYPAGWTYNETMGTKDNVEHITIDSAKFHIAIDSFIGEDANDGPSSMCPDCLETISGRSFTAPGLGSADVKVVTYALDDAHGNALILILPGTTYYIPSPSRSNVYTSFRGISRLPSEEAYQAETMADFQTNPDFAIAQKILMSIAY